MGIQIATFGVLPGVDLNDSAQATAFTAALSSSSSSVLSQTGCKRLHWSTQIEDRSRVWIFLELVKPLVDEITLAYAGIASFVDVAVGVSKFLDLDGSSILGKGVTEVVLFHFPADLPADTRTEIMTTTDKFIADALVPSEDYQGSSTGWAVSDDVPVPMHSGEEGKGVMHVALVGWPTMEAHRKAGETKLISDNLGLLMGLPNMKKLELFHVESKTLEAS